MQVPLQITFRDLPTSEAIDANIRKKIEKLHIHNGSILSCRVVIKQVQKHKHQGKEYTIRIDVTIPGHELAVNKHRNEDVYVAIRDSFNALQRQLENYSQRRRGQVKTHENTLQGRIVRLFENYGFIEGIDGTEYYFSDNHLANSTFSELEVGLPVNFIEVIATDNLQANHITVNVS